MVYRGVDGHIHEHWWDAANGWSVGDLTGVTGAPPALGDPSGYMFEAQGTQHVVYRGVDDHIHEHWWDAANGWSVGDLTGVSGAPPALGDPSGYMFEAQGTQHVVYRGVDGHIHEHWWDAANGWSVGDLTGVSGAPPVAGDPHGYVFESPGTQHVLYRGPAATCTSCAGVSANSAGRRAGLRDSRTTWRWSCSRCHQPRTRITASSRSALLPGSDQGLTWVTEPWFAEV